MVFFVAKAAGRTIHDYLAKAFRRKVHSFAARLVAILWLFGLSVVELDCGTHIGFVFRRHKYLYKKMFMWL